MQKQYGADMRPFAARSSASIVTKLLLCVFAYPFLTGMIDGVRSEVPTERVNGLVTLEFGLPPHRNGCSGVVYKGWVLTVTHCNNGADIKATMFGGGSVQNIENLPKNVVYVQDQSGLGLGLLMIRLPAPFVDRRENVVALTKLPNPGFSSIIGTKLQCYGRGQFIDALNGDPDGVSGHNDAVPSTIYKFRSDEFSIINDNWRPMLTVGFGQFGAKPAHGDSGGPCFLSGSNLTTELVGLISDGRFKAPKKSNGDYVYLGEDLLPVAPFAAQVENIVASGPPTPEAATRPFQTSGDTILVRELPHDYKIPKPPKRK